MKLTLIFAATLLTFVSAACDGPFISSQHSRIHIADRTGPRVPVYTTILPSTRISTSKRTTGCCTSSWNTQKAESSTPLSDDINRASELKYTMVLLDQYKTGSPCDDSSSEHRLCIKTGYDKALEQRQQLHVGLLNKIAQDIWADADPTFKQISVCHFPQLGYLLNILVMEDASEELPT
ncbi:hypothetical protein CF328_g7736 [Tilletia controversa]|nr:hypothetical protein CF328_g7736 [Tilletia controversa]